jgi:hypothetical protein
MMTIRMMAAAAALATAMLATAAPASAQTAQESARFRAAQDRFNNEMQVFRAEFDRYQAAVARDAGRYNGGYDDYHGAAPPPPPGAYNGGGYSDDRYENGYDPSAHYRDEGGQDRVLSDNDRIYRGSDGRYYCKRNDGTTGLIVGGAAGGILGNVIDGGHSRTVGTLLGAAVGAVAGKAIDQSNSQMRCR